jgi:hypothetical protein
VKCWPNKKSRKFPNLCSCQLNPWNWVNRKKREKTLGVTLDPRKCRRLGGEGRNWKPARGKTFPDDVKKKKCRWKWK